MLVDGALAGDGLDDGEERLCGESRDDPVVDGGCGRPIAAPEAGHPTHGDARRPRSLEPRLDPPTQLGRAVEVTREIVAQPDLDRRRWRQPEVRVEGREALKMVERRLGLRGEGLQLFGRQVAMPALNRAKIVEDQGALSRLPCRPSYHRARC